MASTDGPGAEFDEPRRREILEALKDALLLDALPPAAWACLWLGDIETLEGLVRISRENSGIILRTLSDLQFESVSRTWTQKRRLSSAASTPRNLSSPQPSSAQGGRGNKRTHIGKVIVDRSKLQADRCRQRDQSKCVLTKAFEHIDVAHLYPLSMRNEDNRRSSFWTLLEIFWSKERIDTWYNAIFSDPSTTEVCHNLMCLTPDAHRYWARGLFALKPIGLSDDKKRLDVQFFWLQKHPSVAQINILQAPSISDRASEDMPTMPMLFHRQAKKLIFSGDMISLETHDPDSHPLPDLKLLEMQWFLQRLTAMCGAAEPQDMFQDDSDDDSLTGLQHWRDTQTEHEWDMEPGDVPDTEYF